MRISLLLIVALMSNCSWPALGQSKAAALEARSFHFGGGNLNLFISKLKEQFGKEVYELIEVRSGNADRIQVPKMRMRLSASNDVREVLFTYNRISKEGDGFLGQWIYSPQPTPPHWRSPETIVFLGPKANGADGTGGIQVKAFSVRGISADRLKALRELIEEQSRRLQEDIAERSGDMASAEGRVSVHEGTGLLIASGGKTYVELVGTLMDAFRTLEEKINANEPPQSKPKVADPR